jgi:hypothetical protein
MRAIFLADQAPRRSSGASIDWAVVGPADEARRVRTKALLDAGALRTGDDFLNAAMIFQHGSTPSDYLLAHALAVIAATKGRDDAGWMAAATLDRYLQAIGRPQIFGTQFKTADRQNTTQEPYDRNLISDAMRQTLGVPKLADQEKRRSEIEATYRAAPTPP